MSYHVSLHDNSGCEMGILLCGGRSPLLISLIWPSFSESSDSGKDASINLTEVELVVKKLPTGRMPWDAEWFGCCVAVLADTPPKCCLEVQNNAYELVDRAVVSILIRWDWRVLSHPGKHNSKVLKRRLWLIFEPCVQECFSVFFVQAMERWTTSLPSAI